MCVHVCLWVCVHLKKYGEWNPGKEERMWNSPCVEGPEIAYSFPDPLL